MEDYRTLFFNGSKESQEAFRLLKENKINFAPAGTTSHTSEEGKKLPLLITGMGQWEGLSAIKRYIQDQIY